MDYVQLAKDLAFEYDKKINFNQKYNLIDEDWECLYENYITFPFVKTAAGFPLVANEDLVEDVIFKFRKLLSETEYLIDQQEFYPIDQLCVYESLLNYKQGGSEIEEIKNDNFQEIYSRNIATALEFIWSSEITLVNISELFKIVSTDIIDFHPVQGSNMFRAVDLEVYNQYDRLIMNCLSYQEIEGAMTDLVNLMNLNNKRDEYSNLLICCLIKYCFLVVSPFYRYNEILEELLIIWFLSKQVNHLKYFAHNNLFKFNPEKLFAGFYEGRFSYQSQDISLFIFNQIGAINQKLMVYKDLKEISDNAVKGLNILTNREKDYLMIIMLSSFNGQYFNWEMLNDELKKCSKATTKAGVLKILNRLNEKGFLETQMVQKSKMFKLNNLHML